MSPTGWGVFVEVKSVGKWKSSKKQVERDEVGFGLVFLPRPTLDTATQVINLRTAVSSCICQPFISYLSRISYQFVQNIISYLSRISSHICPVTSSIMLFQLDKSHKYFLKLSIFTWSLKQILLSEFSYVWPADRRFS